jgi:catechol 2,3-dioxygenase-like lactoylglutathione lyase family enzyme
LAAALLSLTPLTPAGSDFEATLGFYVDHLGFSVVWRHGDSAGVRRGGVTLILMRSDDRHWAENTSFGIATDDLEALYEEYRILPVHVGPLELKAWGRREFHMIDPAGVCWQFYQATAES